MSQSNLNTFSFQGLAVRTVTGPDGEPRWVAKDVAEALNYRWQKNLTAHIPDEWKGSNPINTLGGMQDMVTLTEAGMFFFLGRSDKTLALPMQKWIAGEVLPAIRKTGTYSVKSLSPAEMLLSQAQVLVDHERQIQTLQTRVEAIETRTEVALQSLTSLPTPDVHPADLSTRAKVNRIVRDHCYSSGIEHREAWVSLYREFRDRYHFDLVERAKHRGLKALEVAELEGQLENLYAVAYAIFGRVA